MKNLLKLLLFIPVSLQAQTIEVGDAQNKAQHFFESLSPMTRSSQPEVKLNLAYTSKSGDETYFYVFNNANGGYVIMGGDETAKEVLGYSENGTFDADQLSPAIRWWLNQYQSQISTAIAAKRKDITANSVSTRAEEWPEVKPLLGGIEWDQVLPYNAKILDNSEKTDPIEHYSIGCVTTATAQVLRYWKYPERGMFSHTYHSKGIKMEANFAESIYHWDLMKEKYFPMYEGTPEENAVAQLMSDLTIALNMSFGRSYEGGSGTLNAAIPYALRTYFGYSKDMELLSRNQLAGMPDGMWERIVYSELVAGRPVIYGGVDLYGGNNHSFVCDGYKDGFFHINWGWDGRSNSEYYLLTSTETTPALAPKNELAGSVIGQYSENQVIIVGIQPDPQSEGFVYLSEPMNVPAEAPQRPLHLEGKLFNPTNEDVKAIVSAQMQDAQGIFIQTDEVISEDKEISIPAKQEVTVSFDIAEDKLIPGVSYSCLFSILDISNPNIPVENYPSMTPWIFCTENTHIEGPVHVMLNMSHGAATLCVPFDAQLPEGVEAYTAESINANHQVIMKKATSIEAGKSYLLKSQPIEQPILLSGMKTTDEVWSVGPVFKGNLTSDYQFYTAASYALNFLNGEPILVKDEMPFGIPPYKIFVEASLSDGADILYFSFDNETGIEQQKRNDTSAARYNLLGQPATGERVVISGGKVIINK